MKKLPKAQKGKIIKSILKLFKPTNKSTYKQLVKSGIYKTPLKSNIPKKTTSKKIVTSPGQKIRVAEGKPVIKGTNRNGNPTMQESKAKRDLQKAINNRINPKKLTKKEAYEKALRDLYN